MTSPLRRTTSAAGTAALLLAVLTAAPSAAEPDPRAEGERRAGPASVTLEGRGFGHGRGMSQYGAQGAASQHDKTYRQILRFYYPGTELGTAGGRIRVLITADDDGDVVVRDRDGLRVRSLQSGETWDLSRKAAQRWRLTPSGGDTRVSVFTSRWRDLMKVPGEAEIAAGGKPLTLVTPDGSRPYRGAIRSAGTERGTVNVLPLEQYLRGVVPREVPALWDPQAVQAQAVAARTYAAHERATTNRDGFDVFDTTQSQVYGGVADEHDASDRAIRATRREALVADGDPIFAQFSASNGGWTVKHPDVDYLPAKEDRWDPWSGNPHIGWKHSVPASAIEDAYPAIGDFERLDVLERDGNGTWNGRVLRIRVIGSGGSVERTGDQFRATFGLRSSWFREAATTSAVGGEATTCLGIEATVVGTDGDDDLTGTPGRDVAVLGPGDDRFSGLRGDDVVCGGDGNDVLEAGKGNDDLFPGRGDDRVEGNNGSDSFLEGGGSDRVNGGVGVDTADYRAWRRPVEVDLRPGATTTGAGSDRLLGNIEHVFGTRFDDVLHGTAGEQSLMGERGDDVLRGHDDNDYLTGGGGEDRGYGGEGWDSCVTEHQAETCEE